MEKRAWKVGVADELAAVSPFRVDHISRFASAMEFANGRRANIENPSCDVLARSGPFFERCERVPPLDPQGLFRCQARTLGSVESRLQQCR